jgi:hypothetical protein
VLQPPLRNPTHGARSSAYHCAVFGSSIAQGQKDLFAVIFHANRDDQFAVLLNGVWKITLAPKCNSRPLGVPALEDKRVQGVVQER